MLGCSGVLLAFLFLMLLFVYCGWWPAPLAYSPGQGPALSIFLPSFLGRWEGALAA